MADETTMAVAADKKDEKKIKKDADLMPSKKEKMTFGQIILLVLLALFTIFCFAPVILVFIAAFTDEIYITQHGFSFFPEKWSMAGMNAVFKYGKQLFTSYAVTIFVTVTGTLFGLLIMSMYAYAISRKGFRLSKFYRSTC